jgi:hypothetical protein
LTRCRRYGKPPQNVDYYQTAADVGAYPRTRIWNFGASITY